jgi:hypothetical protein
MRGKNDARHMRFFQSSSQNAQTCWAVLERMYLPLLGCFVVFIGFFPATLGGQAYYSILLYV